MPRPLSFWLPALPGGAFPAACLRGREIVLYSRNTGPLPQKETFLPGELWERLSEEPGRLSGRPEAAFRMAHSAPFGPVLSL